VQYEEDDEHIGCKSTIKDELPEYVASYVITQDELADELKSREQNNPEEVKLRVDCIA
jgi:hypothetical protein